MQGEENAANSIKTINLNTDSDFSVDFQTQIKAPAGIVTVNDDSWCGGECLHRERQHE